MARVPDIIRRNTISQVAPAGGKSGAGWAALADLAQAGADFVKPLAEKNAREGGFNAVYRDNDGKLKVHERSVLGGEMADIHNSAAFAKFLSQRKIDMSQNFTEMAQQHEFNPAGFKEAADAYVSLLADEEGIPAAIKEELILDAQQEQQRRFNGLYNAETQRTFRETEQNTKVLRDMLSEDYTNLVMAGDTETAEEKYQEIIELSRFRSGAPYITETPAATDAYLRGVRGTAKASRLIRQLTDLEGAEEISGDLREELLTVLEDPDIAPNKRASLYNATQGRLKGIDAAAFTNALTDGSYESMLVRAESGGKNTAKNPNSSALGPHQFTSPTWLGLVRSYKPEWAKGLSDSEVLSQRTDGDKSSEMLGHLRRENSHALNAAGLPVNPATEYMAHFFGPGGAVDVLSADPSKLVSEIVPSRVIKANPFLEGMTARDAQNWAARKMTMKASDMAALGAQIGEIEDAEVRGMASTQLSNNIRSRRAIEQAALAGYNERLASSDDTMTQQEIVEDHDLSSQDQKTLSNQLATSRKKQADMQGTILKLNDPTVAWDRYDSTQRNAVDDVFAADMNGDDPLSKPEHMVTAAQITTRTGFAPKTMFNAVRSAITSNDPVRLATAMEFSNTVLDAQPGAFDPYGGDAGVKNTLSDYQFYSQFGPPQEAAQRIIDNNAPEAVAKRKNLSDAAKEATKGLKIADIKSHFEDRAGWFVDLGNEAQQDEIMSEYERLFKDDYMDTGDVGLSGNRALDKMDRIYGPNQVTGSNRLMKFPPQEFYPAVDGSHDWMTAQLEDELNQHVFGDDAMKPIGGIAAVAEASLEASGDMKWVSAENVKLHSDEITRSQALSGQPVSYVMYYDQDGVTNQLPQRYVFDPNGVERVDAETEFERKHDTAINTGRLEKLINEFGTREGMRRYLEDADAVR